jgi:hypothetical protein
MNKAETLLTVRQAVELSAALKKNIPGRTIRWAALHEFIPGAEKFGRDWMIPKGSFLHWLDHRPRPGRKPKEADRAGSPSRPSARGGSREE